MRALILATLAALMLGHAIKEDVFTTVATTTASFVWNKAWGREDLTEGEWIRLQDVRYRVWNDLCFDYRTEASCIGIIPPQIEKFRPNPFRRGLMGYYSGGNTVFVRNNLYGIQMEEVVAHEMSHYLDVQLGLSRVPGFAKDICFSEKRAWAVSDKFWLKQGYGPNSKKIVGSKWVRWYKHCGPYKDDLYPDE